MHQSIEVIVEKSRDSFIARIDSHGIYSSGTSLGDLKSNLLMLLNLHTKGNQPEIQESNLVFYSTEEKFNRI